MASIVATALRRFFVEAFGKLAARDLAGIQAEQLHGRRIGFYDAQGGGVEDQHGFGRELEQQAIAGLGVAHARVFAIDGLLRIDQPLLQHRDGAQVAADRDDAAFLADLDGGVDDGQVDAAISDVVDLPPARGMPFGRVLQQGFDLGAAFDGDGRSP